MYISLLLRMLVLFGVDGRGRGRLVPPVVRGALWVLCAVFMSGRRADEVALAGEV